MSSRSPTPKYKIPITLPRILSTESYIQKYAPKFINYLDIWSKEKLPLRIRYTKKVLSFNCPPKNYSNDQRKWRPILFKIAKQFRKFCKGTESLDQRYLSSFYSAEICRLTDPFGLPLSFRLGRFSKLTLELQETRPNHQVHQQICIITNNIKRSKLLKTLNINFVENPRDILLRLFLLKLQRNPQLLSSLQNFGFNYKCFRPHDNDPSESLLLNLKDIIQSVTYLILNIGKFQMFNMDLRNFKKLNYLNLTFRFSDKNNFTMLNSLETLTNLEVFIFKTPLYTIEETESFFENFRPPKSIKKISLTRTGTMDETHLSLTQLLKESKAQSFEEWGPSKSLYEKWSDLSQLSDLTLSFEGAPTCSDVDFFFVAPILNQCHSLKRLNIKTNCSDCSCSTAHHGPLQWVHILQALESSKDTLESLEIDACKIYFDEKGPSNFILKNLTNLYVRIRIMEVAGLVHVSSIVPKTIQKYQFFYDLILQNKQEIQGLFNYLQLVPKRFCLVLYLYLSKISSETFEKALLKYLRTIKIEGYLLIRLEDINFSHPEKLQSSIAKNINLGWTGLLQISEKNFGALYTTEKSNIIYLLD